MAVCHTHVVNQCTATYFFLLKKLQLMCYYFFIILNENGS